MDAEGKSGSRNTQSLHTVSRCTTLQVRNLEASPRTPSVRGLWRLHDVTQLIKSLTISDQSIQPPAPLLSLSGGAESSNPLIICWLPIVPHPQRPAQSHLISINSGVVERGSFHFYHSTPNITRKDAVHLGDYKGFRSSGQEPGTKTKIYISYYITISQQYWAESSKMPISGDIYFLCDVGCTVIQ